MQKHVYIFIHDVVCRVISLVTKFSLEIGMEMHNPAASLTIKYVQPNDCNFDLLSFKLIVLSSTIIAVKYNGILQHLA